MANRYLEGAYAPIPEEYTLSDLDVPHLELPEGATPAVLGFLLRDHLLARAQLTATSETP